MPAAWDDPRIARGMKEQLGTRRGAHRGRRDAARLEGRLRRAGHDGEVQDHGAAGRLPDAARRSFPRAAALSLKGWIKPVAEPEIAVHIGRDLRGGGDRAAAAAAIAALAPAIELADADLPFEDPEAILKGNIFQRHVILGRPDCRAPAATPPGSRRGVLRRDAETARTTDPEAATGKLVDIVRHVADLLAAFGERLSAGDIIIAGSVVPPVLVEADETAVSLRPRSDRQDIGGVHALTMYFGAERILGITSEADTKAGR